MTTANKKAQKKGLGIDIGGSGIKGGIVDLEKGELIGERYKIPTPQPAIPTAVAHVVKEIVEHFSWTGPLGITVPSVIIRGITKTANNIDPSWIGLDAYSLLSTILGREVALINDADAAGIAEKTFGAAKDFPGTVLLLTFGTGIGSALISNKTLYPNSELGQLAIGNKSAEKRAASSIKEKEKLSYNEWAERVNRILHEYEKILAPDLFIIGGGISKKSEKWLHLINIATPVVIAALHNEAGIIGAATLGYELEKEPKR